MTETTTDPISDNQSARQPHQQYPLAFKNKVIDACLQGNQPIAQVAKSFDVRPSTAYKWLNDHRKKHPQSTKFIALDNQSSHLKQINNTQSTAASFNLTVNIAEQRVDLCCSEEQVAACAQLIKALLS